MRHRFLIPSPHSLFCLHFLSFIFLRQMTQYIRRSIRCHLSPHTVCQLRHVPRAHRSSCYRARGNPSRISHAFRAQQPHSGESTSHGVLLLLLTSPPLAICLGSSPQTQRASHSIGIRRQLPPLKYTLLFSLTFTLQLIPCSTSFPRSPRQLPSFSKSRKPWLTFSDLHQLKISASVCLATRTKAGYHPPQKC